MNERLIKDITNFIFVSDTPEKADVIFLPGGANPCPAEKGAQLYKGGYAEKLIVSGNYSITMERFPGPKLKGDIYNGSYTAEHEFYTDVLIKNGVRKTDIIAETNAVHTRDNAFLTKKITDCLNMKISKAIICCKPFHARRCLMYYQLAYPDAQLFVVPGEAENINAENWYKTEKGIKFVMSELEKCGAQFINDLKQFI